MNSVERIRQPRSGTAPGEERCSLLGKGFQLERVSSQHRIVLHEDYPLVGRADADAFVAYASARTEVVISGCRSRVHPYRLMVLDPEGYDGFLLDVPQEIRGARQRYPEAWSFVPALVSIPAGIPFPGDADCSRAVLYPMPQRKLLDRSTLLEGLLIRALEAAPGGTGTPEDA